MAGCSAALTPRPSRMAAGIGIARRAADLAINRRLNHVGRTPYPWDPYSLTRRPHGPLPSGPRRAGARLQPLTVLGVGGGACTSQHFAGSPIDDLSPGSQLSRPWRVFCRHGALPRRPRRGRRVPKRPSRVRA
eukprot:scaffold3073_cov93-Isochrysis_galbana.AAC.4